MNISRTKLWTRLDLQYAKSYWLVFPQLFDYNSKKQVTLHEIWHLVNPTLRNTFAGTIK